MHFMTRIHFVHGIKRLTVAALTFIEIIQAASES